MGFTESGLQVTTNGNTVLDAAYGELAEPIVSRPGEVTSGGGFIGGGFGLEGAVTGIAIAEVLNAMTTKTTVTTVLSVRIAGDELHFATAETTPEVLELELAPTRSRVR